MQNPPSVHRYVTFFLPSLAYSLPQDFCTCCSLFLGLNLHIAAAKFLKKDFLFHFQLPYFRFPCTFGFFSATVCPKIFKSLPSYTESSMEASSISIVFIIMSQTPAITIYGSGKTIYKSRLTEWTPRFYGACLRVLCYLRRYRTIKMSLCRGKQR